MTFGQRRPESCSTLHVVAACKRRSVPTWLPTSLLKPTAGVFQGAGGRRHGCLLGPTADTPGASALLLDASAPPAQVWHGPSGRPLPARQGQSGAAEPNKDNRIRRATRLSTCTRRCILPVLLPDPCSDALNMPCLLVLIACVPQKVCDATPRPLFLIYTCTDHPSTPLTNHLHSFIDFQDPHS